MNTLLANIQAQHGMAVDGFFKENSAQLIQLAQRCAAQLNAGRKLLFCGNGGSACDAMHIAGEFVGRFVKDRRALAALALSADTGILTAVANDYDYTEIFSRQIEALGQEGDVLIALSTSGSSPNVGKAVAAAHGKGIHTALFTGERGRSNPPGAQLLLVAPSTFTAHVQEAHMVGLHGLASLVESILFYNKK